MDTPFARAARTRARAISALASFAFLSTLVPGVNVPMIPITGDTTLTQAQIGPGDVIELTGAPLAGFHLTLPGLWLRSLTIVNGTGQTATVRATTVDAGVALATNFIQSYWSNGGQMFATAAPIAV